VAIIWYDLKHKHHPFSVLLMASSRLLVYVVTALAITDNLAPLVLVAGAMQFIYVVIISLVARHENRRSMSYSFPVIPTMLAGIPLLDGCILAIVMNPVWLLAGVGGAVLQLVGQRFVRGD
jgi:4-hydroxybenzoate polyprenyltransferase